MKIEMVFLLVVFAVFSSGGRPNYSGLYRSATKDVNLEFSVNDSNIITSVNFENKPYSVDKVGYSFVFEHNGEIQYLIIGIQEKSDVMNEFCFTMIRENAKDIVYGGYYLRYRYFEDKSYVPDIEVIKRSSIELKYKVLKVKKKCSVQFYRRKIYQ